MKNIIKYSFGLILVGILNLEAIELRKLISDDYPNSFDDALEINFQTNVIGKLETNDDEDWFKFKLQNNDGIIIKVSKITNQGTHVWARLYDINQKSIESDFWYLTNYISKSEMKLNLSAGTYYLKVYDPLEGQENYDFNIRINEEDEPDIIIDAVTMQFCKNNPTECGIVTDYNSNEFYSQSDINKAIQETNTTTINYCKNNPSDCGITIPEVVDYSTLDNYLFENNKWHLVDYEALLILLSSFDENNVNAIKAIWSYSDDEWSVYSFDELIVETIKKSNINLLEKIEKKKGYWVLLNGDNPAYFSTTNIYSGETKNFKGYGKFHVSSKIFDYFGNDFTLDYTQFAPPYE